MERVTMNSIFRNVCIGKHVTEILFWGVRVKNFLQSTYDFLYVYTLQELFLSLLKRNIILE